jgi:hypothetical protein
MKARPEAEDSEPPEGETAQSADSSSWVTRARELIHAVREADDGVASELVSNVSQSRRLLAPLALGVGGIEMLFSGLRVLILNWRLLLVQVLPVMVIWWATYDLKAHLLSRDSVPSLRGPILVPVVLAIIALTAASFFLNSVFAFAVSEPARPEIRPAIKQAGRHLGVILGTGAIVGLMLALAMTVISRAHRPWFVLALGGVIGVMMVCYVAVPARLVGVKPEASLRDKLSASVVAGAVGVAVAAPPYILGRVGVLMLGVHPLFIPGLAVVSIAVALEAGATVAVKAVKMTSKLVAPRERRGTAEP